MLDLNRHEIFKLLYAFNHITSRNVYSFQIYFSLVKQTQISITYYGKRRKKRKAFTEFQIMSHLIFQVGYVSVIKNIKAFFHFEVLIQNCWVSKVIKEKKIKLHEPRMKDLYIFLTSVKCNIREHISSVFVKHMAGNVTLITSLKKMWKNNTHSWTFSNYKTTSQEIKMDGKFCK